MWLSNSHCSGGGTDVNVKYFRQKQKDSFTCIESNAFMALRLSVEKHNNNYVATWPKGDSLHLLSMPTLCNNI